MHPIISAYLDWKDELERGVRHQSWYFGMWQQICAARRNWLNEVWLHEVGSMA